MKTEKLISEIKKQGFITEKQINLLKRRLNNGEKIDMSFCYENDIKITSEQTQKGLNFLLNQWKTPKGKERTSNPFGYNQQEILRSFTGFFFLGFYDLAKYKQMPYYTAIYQVCGNNNCFQYYYDFNGVNITG